MKKNKLTWDNIVFFMILFFSVGITFWGINNENSLNNYYVAAVTSMLQSANNFIFASLDPSGFVTIDKPPAGYWIQTIFAAIFGVKTWVLLLPQVLASIATIIIVHYMVKKTFGKIAGLISAFTMAVMPMFIAMAHTNNIDNLLVLTSTIACLFIYQAARKGSLKYLIFSVLMIGIGFNIKMLQAYMIIPVIYVVYILATKISLKRRFMHLAIATCILLISSISWVLLVEVVPEDSRPYIGGSTENSALELTIGYNGLTRIGLGNNSFMPNMDNENFNSSGMEEMMNEMMKNVDFPEEMNADGKLSNGDSPIDMMGKIGFDMGKAGITRLFSSQNASQASWLIPIAFLGMIAAFIRLKLKTKLNTDKKIMLAIWSMWFLPMFIYFSFSSGLMHAYYLCMIAPGIAGLVGIGLWALIESYKTKGKMWWFLPVSLMINGVIQIVFLTSFFGIGKILSIIVGTLSIGGSLILIIIQAIKKNDNKKLVHSMCAISLIGILIAPTIWSIFPAIFGISGIMPSATPMNSQMISQMMNSESNEKLINFLKNNYNGEKYFAGVQSANVGSNIIIESKKGVMVLGGFSGTDQILTVDELKEKIKNQEIKYFLVQEGMQGMMGGESENSQILDWISKNGVEVPEKKWKDEKKNDDDNMFSMMMKMVNENIKLYDLSPIKNALSN